MSRFIRLATLALVLSACSSQDTPPITQPSPDPARLAAVTIADPGVVRDGDAVPLVIDTRDQRGASIAATISWSVSDAAIATISSGGVLTALRDGTVEVIATASAGGNTQQQRRMLNITLHPATAIELSRIDLELPLGKTGSAAATVRGLDGRVLPNRPVQWTSDNPMVAEVNAAGVVTPKSGGTARIIARYGSLTATLRVTVPEPAPSPETYLLRSFDGLPLPGLVSRMEERLPNGSTRFEMTRIDSGTVTIGATYAVRLYLTAYEGWEMGGNTISRVVGRTTIRDDGYVNFDWFTQTAHLTSTAVGGLTHVLRPINGVQTLTFREGGTNNTWNLGLAKR
jgi:hypothetical protein